MVTSLFAYVNWSAMVQHEDESAMRHAATNIRTAGQENLPGWMSDVLCDLQRAAEDRGLDTFSSHIRQLRSQYVVAPCDCDAGSHLIC